MTGKLLGNILNLFTDPEERVTCCLCLTDNTKPYILTGTCLGRLYIWDPTIPWTTPASALVCILQDATIDITDLCRHPISCCTTYVHNNQLIIASVTLQTLYFWNFAERRCVQKLSLPTRGEDIRFDPNTQTLWVQLESGFIKIMDYQIIQTVPSLKTLASIQAHRALHNGEISAKQAECYVRFLQD